MKTNCILIGDCRNKLEEIPDCYVDTIVTSPPYYGLRDYGVDGQIGLEESPQKYIDNMVDVFRKCRRVLKDDGTLWLNIGDSYWSDKNRNGYEFTENIGKNKNYMLKPKDLMGIPWRVALALQADGWYLRSDIIWRKTNCMPEPVKDRPTNDHEYIFLFSKSRNYYYDYESVKEPASKNSTKQNIDVVKRNKRSVWDVATAHEREAHFATFPGELIEPCILAGSRKGGVVLDLFMGSGTVACKAIELQRQYIGIELNPDYIDLINKKTSNIQIKLLV